MLVGACIRSAVGTDTVHDFSRDSTALKPADMTLNEAAMAEGGTPPENAGQGNMMGIGDLCRSWGDQCRH